MIKISRLSLKNFKSFKRISIPIPDGFTAIVGPNGSGKSNIIDAICFVLGRSSAKSLRAERFSDLIFNGGKKEKQSGEAEVTLYLDNSGMEIPINSKEIKISRTIDATGNSVYRLNGKRDTRAEILDVLSAAKIQPDGHNIILQGDITRIIEMNPLERRGIIDEIAGIAEYDDKKNKAIRELEKASTNLSRINAVLQEVREQLQRLEKEKEGALRHAQLKKEIRVNKGTVFYSHKLEVETEINKLKKELDNYENKTKRIEKFLNTLNVKIEVKKKELEKVNSEIIIKEETQQFSVFKEIEKLKNEIRYFQEKVGSLGGEIKVLEDKRKDITSEIQTSKQEIKSYDAEDKKLRLEEEELGRQIKELRSKIESEYNRISPEDDKSAELRKKLDNTRLNLESEQEKLLQVEKEHALLSEKKTEKERILTDLKNELSSRKARAKEIDELLSNVGDRIDKLQKDAKSDYIKKKELIDESVKMRSSIEKINTKLQLKLEEFAKLNVQYQALEKISQKKISFNRAIDGILALRDEGKIKGIHGTISELGKVNQKYSKALEVAAGRGVMFVVVDDDKIAEECINYLKENQIGRATFLPLNKIKVLEPDKKAIETAKKAYGFAIDLVDFDEKYRAAFSYVFRNTVVVKDVKFAREVGIGGVRMVTLDGDLIEHSGIMSGGFYKPRGIIFEEVNTTKREVDLLQKEIEKLETERGALIKKESGIRGEIERLTSLEAERNRELDSSSGKTNDNKITKEELLKFIVEKEALINEISSSLKEISNKIKKDYKEIERLSKIVSELSEKKKAIEEEMQYSSAENILKEIKTLESNFYELEKKREEKRGLLRLNESKIEEILKPSIARLEDELKKNEAALKEKEVLLEELREKIEALEESLANLKEKEGDVLGGIKSLKERREFLAKGIKKLLDKIEALKTEFNKISKKAEMARIEDARLGTKLEGTLQSLKEFQDLEIELLAPVDTVELEKEIVKMEFEMSSLEPINMRAVEDYGGVKERHDTLNSRVETLLKEIEAIKTLMDEIEHRKKKIFMEVFENVAMNFRRIFAQLSEGGSADLLLDESNPLEGGLMIQAKPVGKNLQYIELMSGGEKTLTALSFIFAIQRYQPAPFYILDEIDMFLDDDNVRKVSELVKDSSKEAQFIVVSLRENLMASASQLFGVSIEEGISKIVGVELEEVAS